MSDWYGSWREKRDEENFKYSIHNDRKIVMAISTDGNRAVWKRKRIFYMQFGGINLTHMIKGKYQGALRFFRFM